MKVYNYENAKHKLLTFALDDECQSFFEENGYYLELAYCKLIHNKPEIAEELFRLIYDENPRAQWGLNIARILQNKPSLYPTYMGIRNFLEIDLNFLINYHKGDYTEEILKYADMFYSVNPETYKYIGRVFWNNGFKSYGKFYLEHAKNHFYQDPELHVLLAQIYRTEGRVRKALNAIENCLEIIPEYFPAKQLKMILEQN